MDGNHHHAMSLIPIWVAVQVLKEVLHSFVCSPYCTLPSPSHGCSYFASTHGTEPDSCRVLYAFWEVLWCGTLKWILSLVLHHSRPSIFIPENVYKLHVGIFYIVNVTSIKTNTSVQHTTTQATTYMQRMKIKWLQCYQPTVTAPDSIKFRVASTHSTSNRPHQG